MSLRESLAFLAEFCSQWITLGARRKDECDSTLDCLPSGMFGMLGKVPRKLLLSILILVLQDKIPRKPFEKLSGKHSVSFFKLKDIFKLSRLSCGKVL